MEHLTWEKLHVFSLKIVVKYSSWFDKGKIRGVGAKDKKEYGVSNHQRRGVSAGVDAKYVGCATSIPEHELVFNIFCTPNGFILPLKVFFFVSSSHSLWPFCWTSMFLLFILIIFFLMNVIYPLYIYLCSSAWNKLIYRTLILMSKLFFIFIIVSACIVYI